MPQRISLIKPIAEHPQSDGKCAVESPLEFACTQLATYRMDRSTADTFSGCTAGRVSEKHFQQHRARGNRNEMPPSLSQNPK